MAPSTPPLPSSDRLAALTIASTSSVVMSATTISICVAPISAVRLLMPAIVSRVLSLRRGLEVHARSHADVVVMRVEEVARRALAVGAQHLEEIIIGTEPAGGVERVRRAGERDPVHIDTPVFPLADAALQLAFVDQLADEGNAAQFRHQRRVERDLVNARHDLVSCFRHLLALERINLHQQEI